MTKGQFEQAFKNLSPMRRKVLLMFLAGKTDIEIRKIFNISQGTVRKHISDICNHFGIESDVLGVRNTKQRSDLIALFATYKPELLPQSPQNDLICGGGNGDIPETDPQIRWVGRQPLIDEIIQKFQGNCRILSIVGITGIGKTSLAKQLTQQPQLCQKFTGKEVSFYQEEPNFEVVARCILADELAKNSQLLQNSEALVNAMIARLKSQPILLIIDMIEVVLEPDGRSGHRFKESVFQTFLERVVLADTMPSRIVLTSQDQPPIMAEERYPEERFLEKRLPGLSEAEAMDLFAKWDVSIEGETTQDYLKRIFAVYEGHPLALRAIAGEVRESPYEGDIEAYWDDYGQEIEEAEQLKNSREGNARDDKPRIDRFSRNLEDLVLIRIENTINRLESADKIAHELLCSGGIYRRPEKRAAWLGLMREVDREKKALAFETLRRRFFLEEGKTASNNPVYGLHPLIRRVALEHLDQLERGVQE